MKKFIAMIALVIGFNANAGLLTIDFSADNINVGETVSVTINATGFDATDMFWFDFNFDNSIMAYDATSLTSDLSIVNTDIGMFDGLEVATEAYGLGFNFFDMFIWAEGDFMLASFDLIATTEGLTSFSLTDFWNPSAPVDYQVDFIGADSVNVSVIPEPSSVVLIMLAIFALVSARRKAH